MFAVLIPETFLELGFHLVLVNKLHTVLLIHAVPFFLIHHVDQF